MSFAAIIVLLAVVMGVFIAAPRVISDRIAAVHTYLLPYGCCRRKFATFHELLEHIAKVHELNIQLPFANVENVTFTAMPAIGSYICCSSRMHTLGGLFDHITKVHHVRIFQWNGADKHNYVDYSRLATAKKTNGGMAPLTREQEVRLKLNTSCEDAATLQEVSGKD